MSRSHRQESPDRLYVITGGRSQGADNAVDPVTLIVAESAPGPGMQSEHATILRLCTSPTAVVEIAAHLRLPVTVVRILLTDLIDTGRVTARHPAPAPAPAPSPAGPVVSSDVLEKVLVALHNL